MKLIQFFDFTRRVYARVQERLSQGTQVPGYWTPTGGKNDRHDLVPLAGYFNSSLYVFCDVRRHFLLISQSSVLESYGTKHVVEHLPWLLLLPRPQTVLCVTP